MSIETIFYQNRNEGKEKAAFQHYRMTIDVGSPESFLRYIKLCKMKPCRVNNPDEADTVRGLGDSLKPDAIVERARKFLEKNLTEDEWYRLLINNNIFLPLSCILCTPDQSPR